MSFVKYVAQPGVVKDVTEYAAGNFWTDSDRVRFLDGFPKTIGGWQKNMDHTFTGVPRTIRAWRTLDDNDVIAFGTHNHLQIIYNDVLYDITPLRETEDPLGADPFTTSSGSSTVTVSDTTHGAVDGDFVVFSGATTFNGVTISGEYQLTYIDADSYTIDAGTNATGSGTGGGASVKAEYLITAGSSSATPGLGWGVGGWGEETWGDPRSASTVILEMSTWSLDLWGEDLIATRRNGGTYVWDASVGPGTRAAVMTNAPNASRFSIVSDPDRHVVCYGADTTDQDPMLIKWSDVEDYTVWTPADTNKAGSQRLHLGTKIVAAVVSRTQTLVLTDKAAFGQNFIGYPFVFGFTELGNNCGCISQNAVLDVNGIPYWMGDGNFFRYAGEVEILPCPVRKYVFEDMNRDQDDKIFAGYNNDWNEVWWFYCSSAATEPDRYVMVNHLTGLWAIGTLARTAWLDKEVFIGNPIATNSSGEFYYHESGMNDDGNAMNSYITGPWIEFPEAGDQLLLTDKLVADADITGNMKVTIYAKKYPNASEEFTKGPYTVQPTDAKTSVRAKGRQIQLKFETDTADTAFKLGAVRLNVEASGGR